MGEIRVIVLSDTHIPERSTAIAPSLVEELTSADLILHLGDFTSLEVLEELRSLGEMRGVRGNCDSYEVCQRLPEKQVLELAGRRIGMTHGRGSPRGLLERVRRQFQGVDVVLFGHSHQPLIERAGGVLYANPGSATANLVGPRRTYLRLRINETVDAELVEL